MLLGKFEVARTGAPRLLLVKARIDDHEGEASAPSQGVMHLGAVARAAGWSVRAIDSYLEDDPERALAEGIAEFAPRVIGLSALTAESRTLHRFAALARRAAPSAVILAGGAHASAEPESTLENPAFDAVAIGEGEVTLREVLDRVRRGQEYRDLAGLAVRTAEGGVRRNPPRASIEDLDSLPMPAWDLTDIDAYAKRRGMSLAGQRRYMSVTTSRGCPYRCTYCHDIHGKRFRSHSPAYVLAMIDRLREEYDVHDFDITDDIWNFDGPRMMEICDGLIERGNIGFTCPNGVRADRMTVEQAEKMADAGCQYVAIAIETATRRLQKQIRKHLRFDKVQPIIDAFTRRDVFTSGFFMVGFPGETEDELRATIDFAVRSKLHAGYFFVVTPFGGTEMHEQVVDGMGEAAVALTGSGMFYRPQKNLSQVPDPLFYALRRNAYLRFYLDPRRIARIYRAHPRRSDLVQYFATMFVRDALRIEPGKLLGPIAKLRAKLPGARPAAPRRTPTPPVVAELPPDLVDPPAGRMRLPLLTAE